MSLNDKNRPPTFNDFVGQEHTIKMLANALDRKQFAHTFIFSGERGCGKTSAARVFGRGLNCEKGITSTPCGKCDYCSSSNMNIIEIDAASNRGIDEIRKINESVKYATTPGKYKVYIIDEVHMLTTEAFNAMLKTLEEPPEHVVFILCTTDPEDIPDTIKSRSQRFNFSKIPIDKIVSRLQYILDSENVTDYTKEGLYVIAEHANGGMRDAITMLEKCLLLNETLTAEATYKTIGLVQYTNYLELLYYISQNNIEKALDITEKIAYEVQPKSFYEQFSNTMSSLIRKKFYLDRDRELASKINLDRKILTKMIGIVDNDLKKTKITHTILKIFMLPEIENIQSSVEEVITNLPIRDESLIDSQHKTNSNEKSVFIHSYLSYKVFALSEK